MEYLMGTYHVAPVFGNFILPEAWKSFYGKKIWYTYFEELDEIEVCFKRELFSRTTTIGHDGTFRISGMDDEIDDFEYAIGCGDCFTLCRVPDGSLSDDSFSFDGDLRNLFGDDFASVPNDFMKCETSHQRAVAVNAYIAPDGMVDVPELSFVNEENLQKVILNPGTVRIGEGAFCGCPALEAFDFPKQLRVLGDRAFSRSGLKEAELPESLTAVGNEAFSDCEELVSASIPSASPSDGMFKGCQKLEKVVLSDSTRLIGNEAFSHCDSLKHIDLPEGTVLIGNAAFNFSGLEEITIPASVVQICDDAFSECEKLHEVRFLGNPAIIDPGAFSQHDIGLKFIGRAGTAVEAFALEHDITFVDIDRQQETEEPVPEAPDTDE